MNEKIDLTKILKDCPKGKKFYSILYGEVEFISVNSKNDSSQIVLKELRRNSITFVDSKGKYFHEYNGECTLFPSKDQRDWSKFTAPWLKKEKFDPKTLQSFDRVLVRTTNLCWHAVIFSHIDKATGEFKCSSSYWEKCIPYNDDTKHIVSTKEEAPEYYRYWED